MALSNQLRRDGAHRGPGRGGWTSGPTGTAPKQTASPTSTKPIKQAKAGIPTGRTGGPTYGAARIALLSAVLVGLMCLAASHAGPVWSAWIRSRTSERELAALEQLESFRLAARFAQWLGTGEQGIGWTVRALASARPEVSFAAEQALAGEMDQWRSLPPREATPRMLVMARELADVAEQLPASRRPFVRRVVERLIEAPVPEQTLAHEMTLACDRILARLPPATPEEVQLAQQESDRLTAESRIARRTPTEPDATPTDPPLRPEFDRDPRELQPLEALPPPENGEGTEPSSPDQRVPKRFFAPRAEELPLAPLVAAPEVAAPPTQAPVPPNVGQWVGGLADLEVMRLLHHGDYGVRYMAERELDRRGYAREHLPLAKQLVHPDPRERQLLAEQLPRLTNIDPRPWLLQLAEDEDASVRRVADNILKASRPMR